MFPVSYLLFKTERKGRKEGERNQTQRNKTKITSVPSVLNGRVDSGVLVDGFHLFGSHF